MRTGETSGRRGIMRLVEGIRGRLSEPWKVWIIVSLMFFLIGLVWPLGEARFFYKSRFLGTSVSIVYLLFIVGFSVVLSVIGAYSWRREQLEREQLKERLERESKEQLKKHEPPIIKGFKKLDLPEHIPIVERLFSEYEEVTLKKRFSGGHENAGVFRVGMGPRQDTRPRAVDRVLKFAVSKDVRAELENQDLIKDCLPKAGSRIIKSEVGQEDEDPSAVVYELARFNSRTSRLYNFGEFYKETSNSHKLASLVRQLYQDVLSPCHKPGGKLQAANLRLYQQYNRLSRKLDTIGFEVMHHPNFRHITQEDEYIFVDLPGQDPLRLRDPLHWVQTTFRTRMRQGEKTPVFEGIVHGDLHSGNILIERLPQGGYLIWVIDFAHTREGHTLDDFCRLEADIKFYLTRVAEDAKGEEVKEFFQIASNFEEQLLSPTVNADLDLPGFDPPQHPQFRKAWACIKVIREEAKHHLLGLEVWPYYLSLLHSTLPVVYYKQCNKWQKKYAFVSAAMLCERIP